MFEYYLNVEKILCTSDNRQYPNYVQIQSWAWGEANLRGIASGTGSGAGKVSTTELHFVMGMNDSSISFQIAAEKGTHVGNGTLVVLKRDIGPGTQIVFMKIELTNVLVLGCSYGGGRSAGSGAMTTTVSLGFKDAKYIQGPPPPVDTAQWKIQK